MTMKVIITPYDSVNSIEHNFFVFDLTTKEHIFSSKKQPSLDCSHLANQGRPTFRPFGIDTDEKNIYIASNDRLGSFDKNTYKFKELLSIPLFINTHQILKNQNYFYTCNTANDSIGINHIFENKSYFLDVNNFILTKIVNTPSHVYDNDTKHVNSLFPYKGKLYFCLHNRGKTPSEFYSLDPSTFKIEKIFEDGVSCHNIFIINDVLYTLSTTTGEIIEYDLNTGNVYKNQIVDPKIAFLRGLDFYDSGLLIGCSNNFKNVSMIDGLCSLLHLNLTTGNVEQFMNINQMYIISDLKVLND
jgi:hypothetical protein